jgi:hypothetical protein
VNNRQPLFLYLRDFGGESPLSDESRGEFRTRLPGGGGALVEGSLVDMTWDRVKDKVVPVLN